MTSCRVLVDPPYKEFLRGRFFDATDSVLNRDDQLYPYRLLRQRLKDLRFDVFTSDQAPDRSDSDSETYYISFGGNYKNIWEKPAIRHVAYVFMEAPSSIPANYRRMRLICERFQNVLLFDRDDAYQYAGTSFLSANIHEYFFPSLLPFALEGAGEEPRNPGRICVIASNKNAKSGYSGPSTLYEFRKSLIGDLAALDAIDLYGNHWSPRDLHFWHNYSPSLLKLARFLPKVYQGRCQDKLATMRRYSFSLCIETHSMRNFVTEKILDCLRSGSVPIYYGATNVTSIVPKECFIDLRDFRTPQEVVTFVRSMKVEERMARVEAGQRYLASPDARRFTPECFVEHLVHLVTGEGSAAGMPELPK